MEMRGNKLRFIGALIIFILSFQHSFAAEETLKNVGFLPSNIWYSKDPFFAGDKIRVYTVIFNGSDSDLEGTVEFYDNSQPIGKSGFSLAGGGRIRDIWIDWTATGGNHTISAKIINPKISAPGEAERPITIANAETGTNERTVDFDINKNGIADSKEIVKNTLATGEAIVLNKIDDVVKKVNEVVPVKPIIEAIKAKVEVVDNFRESQEKKVSSTVIDVKKDLENLKSSESAIKTDPETPKSSTEQSIKDKNAKDGSGSVKLDKTIAEKPFKYVYLFFLSILEYILKIKLLFYGLALAIIFFITRLAYRKIFG